MIADKHTHTQTCSSQYSAPLYLGGVVITIIIIFTLDFAPPDRSQSTTPPRILAAALSAAFQVFSTDVFVAAGFAFHVETASRLSNGELSRVAQ